MDNIFLFIKIFICFIFSLYILLRLKTQDTSTFYPLKSKNILSVNKIFSSNQLNNIECSFKKLGITYNTISVSMIFIVGIFIAIVMFLVSKKIFISNKVACIISIPMIFSPLWIINFIANREQNKLENELNDFFIQLKSALNVNSDIIEALRRIQNSTLPPFNTYIKQLLNEINAGKLPDKALEGFARKINIEKFSLYIDNVRFCHVYGGDINKLTKRTQSIISDSIKQKRKREKETKSICSVLYILIFIDLYMYFYFLLKNVYYMEIMQNSFIGQIILNVNFISIWGVIWLSNMVRKMDY